MVSTRILNSPNSTKNVQEAISSLLSLATAPFTLQLLDDDWVFEPVADFYPPSLVYPTSESTMPKVSLLSFPTVTAMEYITTLKKIIITFFTSQFYGIHKLRDWQT